MYQSIVSVGGTVHSQVERYVSKHCIRCGNGTFTSRKVCIKALYPLGERYIHVVERYVSKHCIRCGNGTFTS